jgi:hypothetical protein
VSVRNRKIEIVKYAQNTAVAIVHATGSRQALRRTSGAPPA